MKTKRVATLNASRLNIEFHYLKNWQTILLIALFLFVVSCNKNDDLFVIDNNSSSNDDPEVEIESILVYTDIEPDFNGKEIADLYNLDLNNDLIIDFTVKRNFSNGREQLVIESRSDYNQILSVGPIYSHSIPLEINKIIFNLAEYPNGIYYDWGAIIAIGECSSGERTCSYDWKGKGDKYLGLRFKIEDNLHYAWARFRAEDITNWVIKDYAYNSTPNMPILAGEKNIDD